MKWLGNLAPWMVLAAYQVGSGLTGFQLQALRPLALALTGAAAVIVWRRQNLGQASDLEVGIVAYLALAALGFWLLPGSLGLLMTGYAATVLYGVLFITAAAPPLFGREPFTCHFARQTAPPAVWQTDLFKEINRHLTLLWAALFAGSALVSLAPTLVPALAAPGWRQVCVWWAPPVLLWGLGLTLTKWYPAYRRRQLGLLSQPAPSALESVSLLEMSSHAAEFESQPKEEESVSASYQVAVVNGSPHVGFGNTSQIVAMLRESLEQEGFGLEEIFLSQHDIKPCTGCALCLEKGACWIRDDYKILVQRVLAADAVILASPVYVFNVTAQMKTFLDRSLGYGHRPRGTWKPGLALSVSAGYGETWVADYLSRVLKIYGAFPVGQFTAIAVGPGEFLGQDTVAARAQDLARDLVRAVREGRRYPATDQDLHFWQFMGGLIKKHQGLMRADQEHWEKLGLYDSFETYVGQSFSSPQRSPEMRQAWLKSLMEEQRGQGGEAPRPEVAPSPQSAGTARELLQMMPGAFNPEASAGLDAVYQFEVSGQEDFTAHLAIKNSQATYHDGPAAHPDVIIKTPADIWLAVATGELDGAQAYMTGQYQVEGDLGLLMRLGSLFSQ
jgi:multimeric flavodoxin WrbA/putative sterol carrier protein